jgi:uncharacterized membrane protein YkoI
VLLLAACSREHEETISVEAVPGPVMSAVRARFPNADVTGAARETEGGETLYEVTLLDRRRKVDVTISPEGKISTIEGALTMADIATPVRRVLAARYPNASYHIVEDVLTRDAGGDRLAYYEFLLETTDGRFFEVQVAPNGKILKEERKSGVEP